MMDDFEGSEVTLSSELQFEASLRLALEEEPFASQEVTSNEIVELLYLVENATKSVSLLLQFEPSEYDQYLHSIEGQTVVEHLRKLVIALASGSTNATWSVSGWFTLPPMNTANLSRLVCQLTVLNQKRLDLYRIRRKYAHNLPQSTTKLSETISIEMCHAKLQKELELLVCKFKRPVVSKTEKFSIILYTLVCLLTTVVSWYTVFYHALNGRPVLAVSSWFLMIFPELIIFRKDVENNCWCCSTRFILIQFIFPYNLIVGMGKSWMLSRDTILSYKADQSVESAHDISANEDLYKKYIQLKNRFKFDSNQAINSLLNARLGLMPLLCLHAYLLVDTQLINFNWNPDKHPWLILPVAIYLLSAAVNYTVSLSVPYLTTKAVPYAYFVVPRLKLFVGLLLVIFCRTFYMVTLLRLVPVPVVVALCLVISVGNSFLVLKNDFAYSPFPGLCSWATPRWILYFVFTVFTRLYQPRIIEPLRSDYYNWSHFLWDFVQVVAFATTEFGFDNDWSAVEAAFFLWTYLSGCVLQSWAFLEFVPAAPRKKQILLNVETTAREAQLR